MSRVMPTCQSPATHGHIRAHRKVPHRAIYALFAITKCAALIPGVLFAGTRWHFYMIT